MRSKLFVAAFAALCLSVTAQAQTAPPADIDYTRWQQLVEACPTVMASYSSRKDELAEHYNTRSDKQFDGALQDCRSKEAEAKYPRPPRTPRDIANYKKIAEAAKRRSAMKKIDESAVKGMKVSTDLKTRAKYRVPASSCGPKDAGQRILVEVGGGVIARIKCP